MKKLVLIPTILLTCLLAFAFAMPGQAQGVLRAVTPSVHLSLPGVFSASDQTAPAGAQSPARTQNRPLADRPSSNGSPTSNESPSGQVNQVTPDSPGAQDAHSVATTGKSNCGRFGNGYHGGKHLFVCPNKPFPPPVISHS